MSNFMYFKMSPCLQNLDEWKWSKMNKNKSILDRAAKFWPGPSAPPCQCALCIASSRRAGLRGSQEDPPPPTTSSTPGSCTSWPQPLTWPTTSPSGCTPRCSGSPRPRAGMASRSLVSAPRFNLRPPYLQNDSRPSGWTGPRGCCRG